MTELQKKGLKELNIDLKSINFPIEFSKEGKGIHIVFDLKTVKVTYSRDHEFYRAVALLLSKEYKEEFAIDEVNAFETFSVMADNSRNAVMKVETLKLFIRKLAMLGYNQLQIYTEDTFEVDNQPFFGYKRGKLTQAEIREVVEYAEIFDIEVIPAIQTLAHFTALSHWQCYVEHIDFDDILLVDDERTYKLIEDILKSVKKCYKSKRINIGMDEAWMLGKGKFLDNHQYEERFSIIKRHLNRVLDILKKYDFEPMMWSDMFFRSTIAKDYFYDTKKHFPEDVKKDIPKDVKLIYWDYYGNGKDKYNNMLDTHLELNNEIWFAGGVWTWMGFAPMNKYSNVCTKTALECCINHKIKGAIMTLWNDDSAECNIMMSLSGLAYAASIAYKDNKTLKPLFKAATGVSYDDWNKLDTPNEIKLSWKVSNSNCCKYYLYNDYFLGIMDKAVKEGNAPIYKKYARDLKRCAKKYPEWNLYFESMAALCSALEIKADLGNRTRALYKANDKEGLRTLVNKDYKECYKRIEKFYEAHRKVWYTYNKEYGFEIQSIRLGGLLQRTKDCMGLLNDYIEGRIDIIRELEEECFNYQGEETQELYINSWGKVVSAGLVTFLG